MKLKTVRKINKYVSVSSVLIILTILSFITLSSFLSAKYVKEIPFNGNVTISVNLAKKFNLFENKVDQIESGAFVKTEAITYDGNEYKVLPGVNIPKNPTIEIVEKTNIPAYLYIEVVDEIDHALIDFEIGDNWIELNSAVPKNDGAKVKVYVYSLNGTTPMVIDDNSGSNGNLVINNIIKGEELTVAKNAKLSAEVHLDFHAYLIEIGDDLINNYNKIAEATNVFNSLDKSAT